jgi:tetratricopeptide (TPR) repeat protein
MKFIIHNCRLLTLFFLILLFSCSGETKEDSTTKVEKNLYESIDGDEELIRINKLLEKEPNNAELLAKRADILFKLFRQDEGLQDISKSFRLDSNNLEVRRVHAGYMIGQLKILAARDDYSFIIERDPGNAEAYLGMARTYAAEGNNVKAFQFTDEALKRNIKFRDAYVLKGLMFRGEGKVDLAISSYQTAVEIDPNYYSGYVALGNLHEIKGSSLAEDFYNTALQIDENGLDALYAKAMIDAARAKIAMRD